MSLTLSLSNDVYEWRKNGMDGCSHVQGCLALITSGTGGYKNMFLGMAPSGEDVSDLERRERAAVVFHRRYAGSNVFFVTGQPLLPHTGYGRGD
jgi:hypothetical protein